MSAADVVGPSPLQVFEERQEPDAVTYEVLRHRLWAINEEHGTTLLRMSGSQAAIYAQDFNPGILTASGEWVYFGPYVQFINAGSDSAIKWILANRAENPGIHPGDIFITNDPWVGTVHQQDVVLAAPVFVGDELLCWVSNTLHMYDIGGITPGSYCPMARDVYDEAPMFPPLKIQERGRVRDDVMEAWLRQSRTPDLMALDLNGMMAGCRVAVTRILESCERYGAPVVSGSMHKVIENAEKVFTERIRALPDGEWRERSYIEVAFPGDRGVYCNALRLRKQGTELYFSNEGSSEQVGSINATSNAWKGSIIAAVNPALMHDQMFAIGGALRHCHFEPEAGRINSAEYPMAVSNTSPCLSQNTIAVANNCIGRMLRCSERETHRIVVSGGLSSTAVDKYSGTNQWGLPFAAMPMDMFIGGISGFSFKDGIDNGGTAWGPKGTAPNVEHNEQRYPMLYLWREALRDTGGAGRYRGGNVSSYAVIPHRVQEIRHAIAAWGLAVPTSAGLFGGEPAAPNRIVCHRDSGALEQLRAGHIPRGVEELGGTEVWPAQRSEGLRQGPDDVWVTSWCGGAGYGDPLDREPEKVAADVHAGTISPERADARYAVPDEVSAPETRRARRRAVAR